jgi:enterochelin esterase-like enzyme
VLGASASAQAPTFKGELTELTMPSKTYPAGRHLWVYTPRGYPNVCGGGCNLVLAFDGAMYIVEMPLPATLDSLVDAKRIAPTVAVLFDNGAPPPRLQDLANSSRFARFVGEELIPWVREHYRVTRAADHTLITGSSAGGLGATFIALRYPALFGNVFSQSGAFWRGSEASNDPPYEWLTQQYANSPKVNVRLMLDVGALETRGALGGAAPSLAEANRHLRDVLRAKGYPLDYLEVPGGQHAPQFWAKRLPVGLAALLPATTSPSP